MKKWKTILPVVLSLAIAASGSLFLYRYIKEKTAPPQVIKVQSNAVPIAVAAVDLAWGTKLTAGMMKTAPFFQESLPEGFSTDIAALKDRVLIVPLKRGEPIVEHRLAPLDIKTGGVSAILTPGKRAIAVKGDKVIGISGFINPGNRVDVLVTMKDPRSKIDKTKTVLGNVLVLATGTQFVKNEKGEPAPVDVYTLEVTPDEGEKLALAASEGKLQFALRNLIDSEKVLTQGATVAKTLASLTAKPKPVKRGGPVKVTVEVIRGSTTQRTRVKY
ncbi:MAG: Flp pilus assembly protein CpaB [Desulfobacteraceae bacterium]|nr:Flp pilus assembly protein CpaB [Desulfobacteraceae bacterium]